MVGKQTNITDYHEQWFNNYISATNNSDNASKLAESYANVEAAAVDGVERSFFACGHYPVTPPDLQISTQKRIPHKKKRGLVIKSVRVRMCQKQCIG